MRTRASALIVLSAIAFPTGFLAWAHFGTTDGISGFVWSLLMREDTEYTSAYTESGFRKISPGMTVEQVHGILGPPHDKWDTSENKDWTKFGERWSWSPGSTNYRCRTILFRKNIVERIYAEFYVD